MDEETLLLLRFIGLMLWFFVHTLWRLTERSVLETHALASYSYAIMNLRMAGLMGRPMPYHQEQIAVYSWCMKKFETYYKQHPLQRLTKKPPVLSGDKIDSMIMELALRRLPRKRAMTLLLACRFSDSPISKIPYDVVKIIASHVDSGYDSLDDIFATN